MCAARCGKYNKFSEVKPCRSEVDDQALFTVCGKCAKGAEALRDQTRMRDHVYKVRIMSELSRCVRYSDYDLIGAYTNHYNEKKLDFKIHI
jgi:hypothetical protein